MGDSDEEYDRRRSRDKFRRERNDYSDRRDDRRGGRDPWEDRGRDAWSSRSRDNGRREPYRDYDRGRRDRYSPPRHDMSPPQMKRMRRDWDDSGGYHHYDMPYGGGGPMPGPPPHAGWGPGPGDMPNMPPQQQPHYGGPPGQRGPEVDYPTQPPMMLFKQFLSQQDDNIGDEDAIKKYNEYKLDYKKQQINEFFLAHKEEEWFKAKYHPEECGKKNEESRSALRNRVQAFIHLYNKGMVDGLAVELEKSDDLVKLLDAAVILMEGGTDFDLKSLDEPEPPEKEETSRSRTNSESQPSEKIVTQDQPEGPIRITFEKKEKKEGGEKTDDKPAKEAPLDINMTPEQEQLKKMAEQFSQNKQQDGPEKPDNKKKKRHRDKTEYSYESGSESESGSASDSESEPAPPGVDEPPPPGTGGIPGLDPGAEAGAQATKGETEKPEKEGAKTEEKEKDTKEPGEDPVQEPVEKDDGPKALHKTNSIFLRNLAPTITKQEVEAMCKRYPGFLRVALQDPQPERRFFRRGWVTFDRTVNIKDICWNLNNIRLRDCEMGAIVNRELKQRVRPINGLVSHKQIVKADIKHGAKIIQSLDTKWGLWDDVEENGEKTDTSKESFGLVSKNPVLKNITDYLVEEGSYEEEELLGQTVEEKPKEANPEVTIDRDEKLLRVLDRMVLYLRIVHSFDFYSAVEYPNEDEMPHRCGIMHARGPHPPNRLTQHDVNDWIGSFDSKVTPFADLKVKLEDEEALKLGRKDHEAEVEKFVTANTQELAKDKWLCPLSGKKFKGPEFVRKHIFNKHGEKVEEVKKEVSFFNNYLMDAKRPQLPEHPGMKQQSSGPSMGGGGRGDQYNMPPGGYQGPPQQGMMAYNQPRPPMMYQGNRQRVGGRVDNGPPGGPYGSHQGYQGRGPNNPYRQDPRRDRGYMGGRTGGRDRTRTDPRSIIEYRDLDAPDDIDIF